MSWGFVGSPPNLLAARSCKCLGGLLQASKVVECARHLLSTTQTSSGPPGADLHADLKHAPESSIVISPSNHQQLHQLIRRWSATGLLHSSEVSPAGSIDQQLRVASFDRLERCMHPVWKLTARLLLCTRPMLLLPGMGSPLDKQQLQWTVLGAFCLPSPSPGCRLSLICQPVDRHIILVDMLAPCTLLACSYLGQVPHRTACLTSGRLWSFASPSEVAKLYRAGRRYCNCSGQAIKGPESSAGCSLGQNWRAQETLADQHTLEPRVRVCEMLQATPLHQAIAMNGNL